MFDRNLSDQSPRVVAAIQCFINLSIADQQSDCARRNETYTNNFSSQQCGDRTSHTNKCDPQMAVRENCVRFKLGVMFLL